MNLVNFHLHLNIYGNIIYANYSNIKNNNASSNFELKLDDYFYNTVLETHNIGIDNFNLSDEGKAFAHGRYGIEDSIVAVISKTLFSNMSKKAAIRNDISLRQNAFDSINNTLTNIFHDPHFHNLVFNKYKKSNNYIFSTSDTIDYNFNNSIFNFPITFHGRITHDDNILKNNCNKIFSGKCYIDNQNDISLINVSSNQEIITYSNTFYKCNLLVSLKQIND